MNALGLIEVSGYLAALEAADAALKAASVKLIGLEKVKAGITTVEITGDVGAINASIEAGRLAAERLGQLRAYHIIARPHEETSKLFISMNKEQNTKYQYEKLKVELTNCLENFLEKKIDEEIEIEIEENVDKIANDSIEKIEDKVLDDEIIEVTEDIKESIEESKRNEIIDSANIESNNKDYNSMRVDELRSLVRKLNIPTLTNKQIKFAKKDSLIKLLLEYKKEGEK